MLDRIGSGGMAEVFHAHDDVLDRPVAVKVFRAEQVAQDDAHGVERQQLEVAALSRLNHPNLIALYDGSIGGPDGHAYIVMELIEGPSLGARIAQGPLPEPSVREIAIQLADGLAYVHAQGMVHRDVKPENILLGIDRSDDDSTVRARLSDFGIVRLLGTERLTSADFTLGTASYLAPEQARGSNVEPAADIYSLGLVLLEALTGRRMFDGPPLEAALARLSQRPEIPGGLPEPWPGLLFAMTETDPRMRPSATEVARVLRNEGSRALPLVPLAVPVAAGFADAPTGMVPVAAAAAMDSGPVPTEPHKRRVSGMAIAAALSLLVILTTLGIFLLTGNDSKSPAQSPGNDSPAAQQSSSSTTSKSSSSSNAPRTGPVVAPGGKQHSSSSGASSSSSSATSSSPAAKTSSHAPPNNGGGGAPTHTKPSTAPPTSSGPTTSAPVTSPATSPTSASGSPSTTTGSTAAGSTAASSAAASSPAAASTSAG